MCGLTSQQNRSRKTAGSRSCLTMEVAAPLTASPAFIGAAFGRIRKHVESRAPRRVNASIDSSDHTHNSFNGPKTLGDHFGKRSEYFTVTAKVSLPTRSERGGRVLDTELWLAMLEIVIVATDTSPGNQAQAFQALDFWRSLPLFTLAEHLLGVAR